MSSIVCKVPADWFNTPSVCLYDWQTLIAGILAVVIGGATVYFLRKQINQTDWLAREERDARLVVARAKLIVPSSQLAHHARRCFDELMTVASVIHERQRRVLVAPLSLPELPGDVATGLDAMLANTRDANIAFAVSAIYGEQQVLAARASDLHEDPRSHVVSFDYYCMQPIIMHAIAINLLTYARREVGAFQAITWDDIEWSTNSLTEPGESRDRLLAFIQDKVQRGKPIPFAIKSEES